MSKHFATASQQIANVPYRDAEARCARFLEMMLAYEEIMADLDKSEKRRRTR